VRRISGVTDGDSALPGGFEVDRGVTRSSGNDEAQTPQSFENRLRQGRALAHHADHLEGQQARYDGGGVNEVVVEHRDLGPAFQDRPVGHRECDILVIVKDGDFNQRLRGHKQCSFSVYIYGDIPTKLRKTPRN